MLFAFLMYLPYVDAYAQLLFPQQSADGKYGYVDLSGNFVIPPQYHMAFDFSDGLALVAMEGEAYIDTQNRTKTTTAQGSFHGREDGNTAIVKPQYYGYIDTTGKVVIPITYKYAGSFHSGFAIVGRDDYRKQEYFGRKYWYINKQGVSITNGKEFTEAHDFQEGLALVNAAQYINQSKYGFIDTSGEYVVQPIYKGGESFSEGLALVRTNKDVLFFIDKNGKKVLESNYLLCGNFSEGLAPVAKKLRNNSYLYGFIDKTGSLVIDFKYSDVLYPKNAFKEGLAAVSKGEGWDFINTSGDFVTNSNYYNTKNFCNGLAAVADQNKKYGFIDKNGNTAIPLVYQWAIDDFNGKFASLRRELPSGEDLYACVDMHGNELATCTVSSLNIAQLLSGGQPSEFNLMKSKLNISLMNASFSVFATKYIDEELAKWKAQGEFEKFADWEKRVNASSLEKKRTEIVNKAKQSFAETKSKEILSKLELHRYDPDKEVFSLSLDNSLYILPIPIDEAKHFKESWDKVMKKVSECRIEDDTLIIDAITFTMPDGETTFVAKSSSR